MGSETSSTTSHAVDPVTIDITTFKSWDLHSQQEKSETESIIKSCGFNEMFIGDISDAKVARVKNTSFLRDISLDDVTIESLWQVENLKSQAQNGKLLKTKQWSEGDLRANGEPWIRPNANTIRFSVSGLMMFSATVQLEFQILKWEPDERVFIAKRTKIDGSQIDSIRVFCRKSKFKRVKGGVLVVEENIVSTTSTLLNMMGSKIVEYWSQAVVDNHYIFEKIWQEVCHKKSETNKEALPLN